MTVAEIRPSEKPKPPVSLVDQRERGMSVVRMREKPNPAVKEPDEMRDFLHVVYRSLKMVCVYLEKRYGWGQSEAK